MVCSRQSRHRPSSLALSRRSLAAFLESSLASGCTCLGPSSSPCSSGSCSTLGPFFLRPFGLPLLAALGRVKENSKVPPITRVCGGTRRSSLTASSSRGLSPRLRGNRRGEVRAEQIHRSIPAPAGEPLIQSQAYIGRKVYPRACGGTVIAGDVHAFNAGLSPRLRGNRARFPGRRPCLGSIPAPAGEPASRASRSAFFSVYPRACGGTSYSLSGTGSANGLSPRLRGNPFHHRLVPVGRRSIPAPAGEPLAVPY